MDSSPSFTITFTGKSSMLESVFFPPIEFLDGDQYQIGLVDFQSYNSIYNVNAPNNVLYYCTPKELTDTPTGAMTFSEFNDRVKDKLKVTLHVRDKKVGVKSAENIRVLKKKGLFETLNNLIFTSDADKYVFTEKLWFINTDEAKKITIPEGNYEISEIEKEIQKAVGPNIKFQLTGNNVTMKCTLKSSVAFVFTNAENMGTSMLGFIKHTEPDIEHTAHHKININSVNVLRIKCNIAAGSYLNGKLDHSIHSFFPLVPPGYKMVEVPKNIIYFPINVRTLDVAIVSIVDQNDKLVDFHDEEITLRCHVRRV